MYSDVELDARGNDSHRPCKMSAQQLLSFRMFYLLQIRVFYLLRRNSNLTQIDPYRIQVQGQQPLISCDVEMRIEIVTHSVIGLSSRDATCPKKTIWFFSSVVHMIWNQNNTFKLCIPLGSFFWTYFLSSKGTLSPLFYLVNVAFHNSPWDLIEPSHWQLSVISSTGIRW